MVSKNTNDSQPNDATFELIVPERTTSVTLEEQKQIPSTPSRRQKTKISSTAANSKLYLFIAVVAMVGVVSGLFLGGVIYRYTVKDLRLEFERNLESLRSDIEHELGVHLMATAAVQKAAEERATKFQHDTIRSIGKSRTTSAGKEELPTMQEIDASPYQHLHSRLLPADMDWISAMMQTWAQTVKIAALALVEWIRNVVARLVEKANGIVVVVMDCIEKTSFRFAVTEIVDFLKNMSLLVVNSFENAISTLSTSMKKISVLPATDLETLASRNPFQDGIWFAAFLRLFFLLLVSCFVAHDYVSDRKGKDKPGESSSPALGRDEQRSKESQEAASDDLISDKIERQEDEIMEQMFHDSVAAAVKLPAVPALLPIHTRPIYTVAHTNPNDATVDPSRPLFPIASRTKISKKEKLRRARINAKAFGAKDKLKLSNAAAARTKTNAAVADTISPADTPASSTPQSPIRPSQPSPSPWTEKHERLEKARANAKIFAARDRQRLQEAMTNSPWKKQTSKRGSRN